LVELSQLPAVFNFLLPSTPAAKQIVIESGSLVELFTISFSVSADYALSGPWNGHRLAAVVRIHVAQLSYAGDPSGLNSVGAAGPLVADYVDSDGGG
jgi:hypothetical protein